MIKPEETEKQRFFKDELESSQDTTKSFNTSLNNNGSFLFGNGSPTPVVEPVQELSPRHDFGEKLRNIIPEMSDVIIDTLYDKFPESEDRLSEAITYYFENFNKNAPISTSETFPSSPDETHLEDQVEIIDEIRYSSTSPQSILLSQKRKRDFGFISQKKLKSTVNWKRFIGALQVTAMATRPTVRPLKYGTEFKLLMTEGTTTRMYDSRGRQKKMMSNYVRIYDIQQNREIGKVSEDIARILYPLLGTDEINFKTTLVFCDNKRLSIGDNFILQLDCYLTSIIFEELTNRNSQNGSRKKHPGWESASKVIVESEEDLKVRSRRIALINLFNKLRIQPITDEQKELGKSNSSNDIEAIDLDDDESFDEFMSQEHEQKDDPNYHEDTMNLNQLKTFYNAAQSFESLRNLPETEPPSEKIKLTLRRYQKQGLTWMLRREYSSAKLGFTQDTTEQQDSMMNPLWKQYKWPKDMSWKSNKKPSDNDETQTTFFFYANLHTGEFSIEKPTLKTVMNGGILSDEMGLGKTISALSLVLMSPYDSEIENKTLFESEPRESLRELTPSHKRPYASKTTLIIVPMSLLNQWNSEFEAINNNPNIECEVYYGGNVSSLKTLLIRKKNPPAVILTTYGIVQNEWSKLFKGNKSDPDVFASNGLFSVEFYRIIIDEGHTIRNRSTITSKAVMDLDSKFRWVLTGTPIINRLDDLYSLVKFLKLEPWSEISYWKTFVSEPFENKNFKQAFDVVNAIMEPVLLRRTKQMRDVDGHLLVELPPKEIVVEKLKLSDAQNKIYKYLLDKAENSVKTGLARGDLLKKYSTILVHILRLRQVCCDMELIGSQDENDEDLSKNNQLIEESSDLSKILISTKQKKGNPSVNAEVLRNKIRQLKEKYDSSDSFKSLECSICTNESISLGKLLLTECGHPFCESCLKEYIEYQNEKELELKCPICRDPIDQNSLFKLKQTNEENWEIIAYDNSPRAAKLDALVRHLQQLQDSSSGEQIIVFSQFSSYLDILERELQMILPETSAAIYKFDGRLSLKERSDVLREFQIKDLSKQKILLLSLKAGGVGLNLTCASHAYMMDPWWSPSMEDQAIDRIHRIGQTNNVKVVRFIIENSIEEKMLRIQERKRTIGEAMDADEDERRKRRIEEIKDLFE